MTTKIIHATPDTPPLRQIAARLREVAATLPEEAAPEDRVTVIMGSLRLTLRADATALRAAAAKYDKGFTLRRHGVTHPTTNRAKFREATFFDLLATEDAATAVAYANLYPSSAWTPKVVELFTQKPELLEL